MTVDGKTVPHPCAGRKLLYQAHVDAVYLSREGGELSIMTVDGSEVGKSDKYCMRLAPDAHQGMEVSRMVVPDDPQLSFLGAPGRIVWLGPAVAPQWRPIWAGLGAFDPEHEHKVPTDFVGNQIQSTLTDFDGPGDMEIFSYMQGIVPAQRLISSREIPTMNFAVGGHAHLNWAFTKAGIYSTTWVGRGQYFDGTVEKTAPSKQYWLVGSDEEVGLPAGTTTRLNNIEVSAEQVRESMGLTEPENPQPVKPEDDGQRRGAQAEQIADVFADMGMEKPADSTVKSGINWLKGPKSMSEPLWQFDAVNNDASYKYPSGPVVEVPDAGALKCVSGNDPHLGDYAQAAGGGWMWVTPARGDENTPSLGVDLRDTDMTQLGQQKVMLEFSGNKPAGAQFFAGIPSREGLMPLVSSMGGKSKKIQLLQANAYPVQWGFTHPGIYALSGEVSAYLNNGDLSPTYKTIYFAVGNEAINHLRKASDPNVHLLPEGEKFTCEGRELQGADPRNFPIPVKGGAGEPDPGAPGTEPGAPGTEPSVPVEPAPNPTNPQPDPNQPPAPPSSPELTPAQRAVVEALRELWAQNIPSHVILSGHMDLALANEGDSGVMTFLKDGANASRVVHRPSGSFVIAAPQSARVKAGSKLTDYAPEFGTETYQLPQTQQANLPWLGFSTDGLDYRGLMPGSAVTISLRDFTGPGRMVTGHTDLTGSIDVGLDSANLGQTIVYAQPAHDHQNFWFSAPGVYRANFLYQWQDSAGNNYELPLVTYFLVGDDAVRIGRETVANQTLPEAPAPGAAPNPGTPPAPEPGTAPGTEPAPEPAPGTEPGTGPTPAPVDGDTPEVPGNPGNPGDLGTPGSSEQPTNPAPGPNPAPKPTPTPAPGASVTTPGAGNTGSAAGQGKPRNPFVSAAVANAVGGAMTSGAPLAAAPLPAAPLPAAPLAAAPLAAPPLATGSQTQENNQTPTAAPTDPAAPLATAAPEVSATGSNGENLSAAAVTASGYRESWLSGFLLGIGVMSLIGGVTLLVVAQRKLSQK